MHVHFSFRPYRPSKVNSKAVSFCPRRAPCELLLLLLLLIGWKIERFIPWDEKKYNFNFRIMSPEIQGVQKYYYSLKQLRLNYSSDYLKKLGDLFLHVYFYMIICTFQSRPIHTDPSSLKSFRCKCIYYRVKFL